MSTRTVRKEIALDQSDESIIRFARHRSSMPEKAGEVQYICIPWIVGYYKVRLEAGMLNNGQIGWQFCRIDERPITPKP